MAPRKSDEDLFQESSMTFGEHLEELRICLWRALIGVMIGFLIGLLLSGTVVKYIQTPLEAALTEYYGEGSAEMIKKNKAEFMAAGYGKTDEDIESLAKYAAEAHWMPEEVHISPAEFVEKLGISLPQGASAKPEAKSDQGESPDSKDGDEKATKGKPAPTAPLTKIYIWHKIDVKAKSLNAHEAFSIFIKAGLVAGLVISSPWVFYQFWTFVAAGLYSHERSYVHLFMPISLGLFLAGVCIAFFFVFDPVLDFLFRFNRMLNIDPDPRISEWLSFVLILPLGFGIAFQLPLVMFFLERIGLFSIQLYEEKWRIAVLVICVLAMFLTPADPYSMMLLAAPLTLLYVGGIMMCKLLPRRVGRFLSPD